MNIIVEVKNLMLAYDEVLILKNVSFSLRKGECLVIMGGSGCGKSTLLKSMIGLMPPQEGSIQIFGENLWDRNQRKKMKSLKGLVFCFKAVLCGVQCRFLKMLHYHWSYSVTWGERNKRTCSFSN